MTPTSSLPQTPIELPDGLILRRGTPADVERLVEFHARIQDEGEWTRALADGSHPNLDATFFTIVEDPATGGIASSMCYIPQTWYYGGIPFRTARLEMVSTDPAYRWRGLVRRQFEALHAACDAEGQLFQVVVGRPWVYRRFGYTQALQYWGGRSFSPLGAPLPPAAGEPAFRLRPAQIADLPFAASLERRWIDSPGIVCIWEEDQWRNQLFERPAAEHLQMRIIESASGEPRGMVLHAPGTWEGQLSVFVCQLQPGASWHAAAPEVLRALLSTGQEYAARDGGQLERLYLGLGSEHPLYASMDGWLSETPSQAPYAWYVHLPDLARFVQHVAPVLEQRLAASPAAGFSGELALSFYERDQGLTLTFANGRITSAHNGAPSERGVPALPREHFLPLILGYKSLAELEDFSKEVHIHGQARLLLPALFPKTPSRILSIA